jgi:DNA invertase Pin-like site-specific DNA recombinase
VSKKRRDDLAVAYLRVSTSKQEIGPEAQEAEIRIWCERHSIELATEPFLDRVSGGSELLKRPALLDAIEAMREHRAGILVAHKRDRFARDTQVIGNLSLYLRKQGVRLCTTEHAPHTTEEEAPFVRAIEGIQDVFAEFERSMIRARTKGALAVKRRRGERIGTIPYGSKLGPDGVRLIPEPSEQKIVKLVRRLRDEGLSLRVIAAELDARGLRPRRGKRWYPTTIKKIVERTPNPKGSR